MSNRSTRGNRNTRERRGSRQRKEELKLQQEQEKKRNIMYTAMAAIILVSAIVALAFFGLGGGQQPANTPIDVQGAADNTYIEIPLADITDNAQEYSYTSNGVRINYFVVNGPDGEIHTAFDACDSCYREKKGYVQEGDVMKCNNCGLTFNLVEVGTNNVGGGCWPGMLEHLIQNGNVIIQKADIEAGAYYFR